MPEGHTLHRIAREQTAKFGGRPVLLSSPQGRFAESAQRLDGRTLERVEAYGKHLFQHYSSPAPDIVHIHLGLYGKFAAGEGEPPEPKGALRLRMVGDGGWTDLRGATACELITAGERLAILDRLGPDPLRRGADGLAAFARIARSSVSIAALVMDQTVLAGVGNVYRAELLFRHRVPPMTPGRMVDIELWQRMWADLVLLMRDGVKRGRIITTAPADRSRRSAVVLPEDSHYVYRRTGLPCRVCLTPIATTVLVGRNLFWCPKCQAA
jgi:endonuclease-8